jgi:hypothetical protein
LAKAIAALKAVSQNLMHSNISIIDGVYGILSNNDVRGQVAALGKQLLSADDHNIEELKIMTKQIFEKLGITGF